MLALLSLGVVGYKVTEGMHKDVCFGAMAGASPSHHHHFLNKGRWLGVEDPAQDPNRAALEKLWPEYEQHALRLRGFSERIDKECK